MKTGVSVFVAMMVLAGLCIGCGTAEKLEPAAVKVPTESDTTISEPEKTNQPSTNAGHSHEGHSHTH